MAPGTYVEPDTLESVAGRLEGIAGDFRGTGNQGVTALEPVSKALTGFALGKAVDGAHKAWRDRTTGVADTLAGRAGTLRTSAANWRGREGEIRADFGG